MRMLPEGWSEETIADLVTGFQYGYTAKAHSGPCPPTGIRFLRITDIASDGSISWDDVPACTIDNAHVAKYQLRDGDIVLARTGSIEKATRVKNSPRAVFASYLIRARPLSPELGDWLRVFLRTLERVQRNLKRYRGSILKAAGEGGLVPTEAEIARAEGRDYEPASVLLQRILVERRRRWEEAELARMKAAGKKPKNDRWKARYKEPAASDTATMTPVPEGWCWVTVDQVLSEPLVNGRSVKSADRGFPILRLTLLQNGAIDLNERKIGAWRAREARRFVVRIDDFFVSRGNASIRLVAAGGLVREVPDPIAFPDTLIRIRLCSGIDLRFLAAMWNSRIVRGQLEQKAKTTAGIFKVNQDDLATCVLLPAAVGRTDTYTGCDGKTACRRSIHG